MVFQNRIKQNKYFYNENNKRYLNRSRTYKKFNAQKVTNRQTNVETRQAIGKHGLRVIFNCFRRFYQLYLTKHQT